MKAFKRQNTVAVVVLTAALMLTSGVPASAGSSLESIDLTGNVPSPVPGHLVAKVVGISWDSRCIPVGYRVNDTQDPVPNPLGPAFLSVADSAAALQDSMDSWNDIRTSFIRMDIVGEVSNPGLRTFDFVNELTFRTPPGAGFIASSPSVSLIIDSFLADGDDLDGDGDSDVSNTLSVCADVDGDGDLEFPEGNYSAGTILDNDVQFNAAGLRFTVADADIDTVGGSVDLEAVAVHELGHSHGLGHVVNNQIHAFDGTSATMFPFISTTDPDSELSTRSLDTDDIAFSSFFYPEGTATSGPAALQPGDLPFSLLFGVIEGEATHGGQGGAPLAGASVSATRATGSLEATAISGTTQLSFDPVTGGLFPVSPGFNIVDGAYSLPVPLGFYRIGIEALDGFPVPAQNINFTTLLGSIFGQQGFNEEFYNGNQEAAVEAQPGRARFVLGFPGHGASGIDLITNVDTNLKGFGTLDFVGLTGAAPETLYTVAFPGSQIAAADTGGGLAMTTGLFFTLPGNSAAPTLFANAWLSTCDVNPGVSATVDLDHPLRRDRFFVGQDTDFAPFYFRKAERLGDDVLAGIASGDIDWLCLTLQIPDAPFPGSAGLPPLIGLDGVPGGVNDVPILGQSFTSTDRVTWTPSTAFNFMFGLVVSEKP